MKKLLIIIGTVLCFNAIQAQIEHEGNPIAINNAKSFKVIPVFTTSVTNIEALRNEDKIHDKIKDIPWRYGYIHYVDLSFQDGVYDYLPNGDRIWRINIKSENAQTLNLTFNKYKLEAGAKLFIYNENKVLGAFTSSNNKEHGFLTTTLIEGDELTIELYEPKNTFGNNELNLERVVHGYRSLDYKNQLKAIGDSGNCNNNVICQVGDDWENQIRSVGILLSQNNYSAGFCTGALINNTCNDGTPYFLTANHCMDGKNPNTIIIGFNFQSLDCNTNNWAGNNHTISGTMLRASNPGSDMSLLELSSVPPVAYNVFYAGWDNSDNFPTKQIGIHHPAGDLKKISFDNNPATQDTYSGAQCWRIGNWEDGTTEGGSSGSPLFNQDGNIIGQLYGGGAACGNTQPDFYGRFDISWDNGSGPTDELQSWLDGCNTGAEVLLGYDPNAVVLDTDAFIRFNNIPNQDFCGQKIPQVITLRNRGVLNLTEIEFVYGVSPNVNIFTWQGNLASNETADIILDSLELADGNYNYQANITLVNGILDENQSNDTVNFDFDVQNGVEVAINITTNFAGNENYLLITEGNDTIIEEGPFGQLQSYSFNYCLGEGDYCINMYDDGGNGLSPTFLNLDEGNYQLVVDNEEIFNGDNIGSLYEHCFEVEAVEPPTSINNITSFNDFILYPNPTKGLVNIESSVDIKTIEVFDLMGAIIYRNKIGNNNTQIDLKPFSKGIYFVKVYTEYGTGLQKIIVE